MPNAVRIPDIFGEIKPAFGFDVKKKSVLGKELRARGRKPVKTTTNLQPLMLYASAFLVAFACACGLCGLLFLFSEHGFSGELYLVALFAYALDHDLLALF